MVMRVKNCGLYIVVDVCDCVMFEIIYCILYVDVWVSE